MHSLPLCSSIPHRALRPHATHGSYLLCLQTDLNLAKGKATINISGDQVKYQIRYTSKKKKNRENQPQIHLHIWQISRCTCTEINQAEFPPATRFLKKHPSKQQERNTDISFFVFVFCFSSLLYNPNDSISPTYRTLPEVQFPHLQTVF